MTFIFKAFSSQFIQAFALYLRFLIGDANTQRRQVHRYNRQATMEIHCSTRFTLLLLVCSCLFKALPDCAL